MQHSNYLVSTAGERYTCAHMDELRDVDPSESSETRSETTSPIPERRRSNGIFGYTVFALGLALFIRFFIATPYVVSGASMEPTFADWEYLIVDKVIYDIEEPERGDVIVFTLPGDSNRSLIKRVIGLPGETVLIRGANVSIVNDENPSGFTLSEPYVNPKNASSGDIVKTTLGDGEYFVLGDNRRVSADSRVWGMLPEKNVTGRVDVRLFPLDAISILPGRVRFEK